MTGMLFQDFAIFPHLSVHDNIAYSLHHKEITRAERERRILEISDNLSITAPSIPLPSQPFRR